LHDFFFQGRWKNSDLFLSLTLLKCPQLSAGEQLLAKLLS